MKNYLLAEFEHVIREFSVTHPFSDQFLIKGHDNVKVFYSPFEYVNTEAKLVLVGMSPGATQASNANRAAQTALLRGDTLDRASQLAKETGAFSGPLRKNLVALLDHIGVNEVLDVDTCASLFEQSANLVHSTSVFRYPTLLQNKPISSAKKGLTHPLLKEMIDVCLASECEQLGEEAIYIPLGQGVDLVLNYLADGGFISHKQILNGLLHPSGANNERINYFLGKKPKEELSTKTNAEKIDAAKSQLVAQVQDLLQFTPAISKEYSI